MFITHLSTDTIDKLLLQIKKDSPLFLALSNNQYAIYYSYNEFEETILYEAILQLERSTLPMYLSFKMKVDGSYQPTKEDNKYNYVYYLFILQSDYKLYEQNIELLWDRYQKIKEVIHPLITYENKEIKERMAIREQLNNVFDAFSKYDEEKRFQEEIDLSCSIRIQEDYWDFSFKIGKDKMVPISSLSRFFDCIRKERYFEYNNSFGFVHELSAFTPQAQKIITILSQSCLTIPDSETISLYPSQYIYLLLNMKELHVLIELENSFPQEYYIDPEEITCKVDKNTENSNSTYTLVPEDSKRYFVYEKRGVLLREEDHTLHLLSFKNSFQQMLFTFFKTYPNLDYSQAKDIIAQKLLPFINSTNKKRQPTSFFPLTINLYIDLDNNILKFHTEYIVDSSSCTKEQLKLDYLYRETLSKYLQILDYYQFPEEGTIEDDEQIISFFRQDLSILKDIANVYLSESIKRSSLKPIKKIQIHATFGLDWLNLQSKDFPYTPEEISEILSAYKKKKKFYRLKDDIILLDKENLDSLEDFEKNFNALAKEVNVPLYQVFNLARFKNMMDFDDKIKEILYDIQHYKSMKYNLPTSLIVSLRRYQIEAVQWLLTLQKYHLSGILADDMGLGKTIEVLSYILAMECSKPILIITPKSLLYNWESEIIRWKNILPYVLIHGKKEERLAIIDKIQNKKILYITTYDSIRVDVESYSNKSFSLIVLDEAQAIKNMEALRTKAVKQIQSDTRLVLTGTPIENSLSDLWSIFDFLMPNYLKSYKEFRSRYEVNIESNESTNAKLQLNSKVAPFILRRTKDDVLKELPPKTEEVRLLELSNEQKALYDATLSQAKLVLKNKDIPNKILVLTWILHLRQICVDPSVFVEYPLLADKLAEALLLVENAISNHHKVIIFSSFRKVLAHLGALLHEKNIHYSFIHGDVEAKSRVDIAEDFNTNENTSVILVTLKSGGYGLNLIGGDIVLFLDPWWNRAAENQAADRAYRLGQSRKVHVIRLVCKDTIEEKIMKLQDLKNDLIDGIIPIDGNGNMLFTEEQIAYLLSD